MALSKWFLSDIEGSACEPSVSTADFCGEKVLLADGGSRGGVAQSNRYAETSTWPLPIRSLALKRPFIGCLLGARVRPRPAQKRLSKNKYKNVVSSQISVRHDMIRVGKFRRNGNRGHWNSYVNIFVMAHGEATMRHRDCRGNARNTAPNTALQVYGGRTIRVGGSLTLLKLT
jgi:hypothetical protein